MERDKNEQEIEDLNRRMGAAPEGDISRRRGEVHTAMTSASGAAVQHGWVGAATTADEPSSETGETADALKRAAENDGRV